MPAAFPAHRHTLATGFGLARRQATRSVRLGGEGDARAGVLCVCLSLRCPWRGALWSLVLASYTVVRVVRP